MKIVAEEIESDLAKRIRTGLGDVIDPELGRDIVGLGLIYLVETSGTGEVRIVMTTTTPGCPAAGFMVDAVRCTALAVDGVRTVDVQLTHEPRWHPGMMAP